MPRTAPASTFVLVSGDQAIVHPYPYIYVNADGSVRELHSDERRYLETRFSPFDGNRPYTKDSYSSENGWGESTGFLKRELLPEKVEIQAAPMENPIKLASQKEIAQFLHSKGLDVTQTGDGRISVKKPGH